MINLSVRFLISTAGTLLSSSFFPLQLFFPFLALIALRLSQIKALWISALCGLFLDLLSSQSAFGLHAVIFSITMFILYSYRRYFFEEKWLPFTLYATIFSSLASLFFALTASVLSHHFYWSFNFIAIDLFLLPFWDAICGYLLFITPKLIVRFFKHVLLEWRWRSS